MIRLTGTKIWILSILILFSFASVAYANNLTDVFINNINSYVNTILTTNNDVKSYAWMMLLFLIFLALFTEITSFIFNGVDPTKHLTTFIMILITLTVWKSYIYFIDMIWIAGNGIGMSFQQVATGNTDPLFLSKWINKTVSSMIFEDFNFWSSGSTIVLGILWSLVALIIQFLMYLASMFAEWGLALSKIIGILFIPFLAYEPTRKLFDSWFRFFIGWIFLMLTLRITSVIAAITIQSQIQQIGLTCSGRWVCIPAPTNGGGVNVSMFDSSDILFSMIIAILFICSSFGFAKALSSGVGDSSQGISRSTKAVATKVIKAALL